MWIQKALNSILYQKVLSSSLPYLVITHHTQGEFDQPFVDHLLVMLKLVYVCPSDSYRWVTAGKRKALLKQNETKTKPNSQYSCKGQTPFQS